MPDVDVIADVVVATVQRAVAPLIARLEPIDQIARSVGDLRERVAVLETRAPVPGPPGTNGTDGADGLGFDDLSVDFDGDRTLAFTLSRGGVVKSFPVVLPFLKYQGAYAEGVPYVVGDVVTSGGNAWHCQKPTTLRPGDSVATWKMMVRKGRDGRDGTVAK